MTQRYACVARGCPMAGTITRGRGAQGVCGWHATAQGSDWPRITQALVDWGCLVREIRAARQALNACAPGAGAQDAQMHAAWQRLAPLFAKTVWTNELEPRAGEGYGPWSYRLGTFLEERVAERLRFHAQRFRV